MDAPSRFPEIDVVRGFAILMMVLFHTLFDISFFGIAAVNVATGFWRYFAMTTASLFLCIVGISLVVSHARSATKLKGFVLVRKYLLRGAGIFALGLLVTVATWWYLHEGFVLFGILHLIGVSVMLSPLFFRFGKFNILIGLLFIAGGAVINTFQAPIWLLPLGIYPPLFTSVDYTPLVPWFGVVLAGMGIGDYLYAGGVRQFSMPGVPGLVTKPLAFLGRHSLIIYLVHQPVIILLLGGITGTTVF